MIALRQLSKTYPTPAGHFTALRAVDLDIPRGQAVAIVGRSGSGKSTMLNLIGGIDRPSAGTLTIGGTAVHELPPGRMARWRGTTVGFVFQFFQLLPTLTAAENVMLPMDLCATATPRERQRRAMALLERMGVASHADKLPSGLSGGEQQRVAIARALANDPPIVLADEPTGNLDAATSEEVFALFRALAREGKTVVIVTHERDLAATVDRTVTLADGAVA